jgi:transcriptional regulator with XRE-family HTH domain
VTLNEAIRALRKHVGKTQQIFATELGISISSLNNYERKRTPEPKQLFRFERAALDSGRGDLAEVFRDALVKSLGVIEPGELAVFHAKDDFEVMVISTVLLSIRGGTEAARPIVDAVRQALALSKNRKKFIEEAKRRGFMNEPSGREKK